MAKCAIQMSKNDNTFLLPKYRLFQHSMQAATCGWCRCEVIVGHGLTPKPPSRWRRSPGQMPCVPGLWLRLSIHRGAGQGKASAPLEYVSIPGGGMAGFPRMERFHIVSLLLSGWLISSRNSAVLGVQCWSLMPTSWIFNGRSS